jgi:hypothetical protein
VKMLWNFDRQNKTAVLQNDLCLILIRISNDFPFLLIRSQIRLPADREKLRRNFSLYENFKIRLRRRKIEVSCSLKIDEFTTKFAANLEAVGCIFVGCD